MKYHKSSEVWKRCRAVLRPGQGVELCPLDGKSHALGRQGIAERGGGIEERTSNGEQVHIKISAIEGGLYTVKSPKGFTRIYRADGTLLSLRERSRLTKLADDESKKEEVEAPPAIEHEVLAEMLSFSDEQWFEKPWAERKKMSESLFFEMKNALGIDVAWKGWDRSTTALGRTYTQRGRWRHEEDHVSISLSDLLLRARSPRVITNTVIHELAHAKAGHRHDHNSVWKETFGSLAQQVGVEIEATPVSPAYNEVEIVALKAERAKAAAGKKRYIGHCPEGHTFYSAGLKRGRWGCAHDGCKDKEFENRVIAYKKNPDYESLEKN